MDGMISVASRITRPARWFEDFCVGEKFVLPPRTLTAETFRSFAEASGEAHPLHTDRDYCTSLGLPDLQASGFMIAVQAAAGAGLFPFLAEESLVGLVDQSSRCVRHGYAGDTLSPVLQISELVPSKATGLVCLRSTLHNQRRELVMEGLQRWLLRRRPRD